MTLKVMEVKIFNILIFDCDYFIDIDGEFVSIFDHLKNDKYVLNDNTVNSLKNIANAKCL